MAWYRGDKSLSYQCLSRLLTHTSVILPLWELLYLYVNTWKQTHMAQNLFSFQVGTHIANIKCLNYDVIKWKHFPRYWPFVRGIHLSLVDSPHKGQWRQWLGFLCESPLAILKNVKFFIHFIVMIFATYDITHSIHCAKNVLTITILNSGGSDIFKCPFGYNHHNPSTWQHFIREMTVWPCCATGLGY